MTIRQMAKLAGVSVRTLQRLLAAEGLTFSQLAEQALAELARELLKDSDLTIDQIATQLGYSTPSNFSRAFQRWTGKSPAAFRGSCGKINHE